MDEDRLRCAEVALRQVPEYYRKIDAADVAGQDQGHSVHHGMHIGWAWGDDRGRGYLDFLSEHRHPGMSADRYYVDGRIESIPTPTSMRQVASDPAVDAELEHQFIEQNRTAYADLRKRGLLPPVGENLRSQDITEYLTSRSESGDEVNVSQTELSRYDRGLGLLGGGWDEALNDETGKPYWRELLAFVADERSKQAEVYPPAHQTFHAFTLTPLSQVKVVILGQDPYPNAGQAHGLAFSVPVGVKRSPPSLRNIHKVLEADLTEASGRPATTPANGSLEGWAEQGVLLLNTALTVRNGDNTDRRAHRRWKSTDGQGWSTFTDAVIKLVNDKSDPVVFILWGNDAKSKQSLIDTDRHTVIKSSHPSPFSARLGFLDSRPFSAANAALGPPGIDWERVGPTP